MKINELACRVTNNSDLYHIILVTNESLCITCFNSCLKAQMSHDLWIISLKVCKPKIINWNTILFFFHLMFLQSCIFQIFVHKYKVHINKIRANNNNFIGSLKIHKSRFIIYHVKYPPLFHKSFLWILIRISRYSA